MVLTIRFETAISRELDINGFTILSNRADCNLLGWLQFVFMFNDCYQNKLSFCAT